LISVSNLFVLDECLSIAFDIRVVLCILLPQLSLEKRKRWVLNLLFWIIVTI